MGDVRFAHFYRRVRQAEDPAAEIQALSDEGLVAALAAAADETSPYLANVLATELMNRLSRAAAVISNLGEGVYAVDAEGRIITANPAVESILRWRREELIGRPVHEVFGCLCNDDLHGVATRCPVDHLLATGETFRCDEGVYLTREGSAVHVQYTASPLLREDEIMGAVVVFRDVTERKRAQAAMREMAAKLRTVVTSVPLILFSMDADGIFTLSEGKGLDALGFLPGQVVGLSVFDVYRGHPDVLAHVRRALSGHPATARVTVGGRVFETTWIPLRGADDGPVEEVIGVSADMTERFLAEESLRESEARYRAIVETAHEGIGIVDAEGRITYMNERFADMLGYRPDELVGRSMYDAIPRSHWAEAERHLLRRMAGLRERVEFPILRKDGEVRWTLVSTSTLFDAEGRFSGAVSMVTDVTDLRETEQALRRRTAQLATAERLAALGSWSWDVHTGELSWSDGLYRIFGVNPGSFEPTYTAFLDCVHPDDRDRVNQALQEACADRRPYFTVHRAVHPDGAVRWLECHGEVVEWDEAGKPVRMVGTALDVTEQREIQVALERSEARFRKLSEAATEAVILHDTQRVLDVNRAGAILFGYEPEEMVGMPIKRLGPPEAGPAVMRAIAEGREKPYETVGLRKDGTRFPAEVSAKTLMTEEGPQRVVTIRDITRRKEAEREIRRLTDELERRVQERTRALTAANSELEAFTYSVSHDLRAPLRGIDYFSGILEEEYADRLDEEGQRHLRRVRDEARHMAELISELLDLSRASRGSAQTTEVDLSALAHQVVADLRAREPSRRVEVHVFPGLTARGNPRLLEVVLDNLLGNAWKFTRQAAHPRIEVGERRGAEGERVFFVRDNGAGFDMEKADRLFRPFERLHDPSEFEGTGVGLATVRRIVERHGGRVWAEGRPGQGATFYFTLGGA